MVMGAYKVLYSSCGAKPLPYPIDLRDDCSLTHRPYVDRGLEIPGDLVAVVQDIDVSLKLLTAYMLC